MDCLTEFNFKVNIFLLCVVCTDRCYLNNKVYLSAHRQVQFSYTYSDSVIIISR